MWSKLSSDTYRDARFLQVSDAARWLWACGESYSADFLTDGFVPMGALKLFDVRRVNRAAMELVQVKLWRQEEGGFHSIGYCADEDGQLKRNPTAAEYLKDKESGRFRANRSYQRRLGRLTVVDSSPEENGEDNGERSPSGFAWSSPDPVSRTRTLVSR